MIFSSEESIDGSVNSPMSPSPREISWSLSLLKIISVFCAIILLLLLVFLCTIWAIKHTEEPTFRYVTAYNKEGKLLRREDIEKTTVDVLKPIIFLINGLDKREASADMWYKDLLEGYLEKQTQNVFLVDWHFNSEFPNPLKKIQSTGTYLAEFISYIFNKTKETYLDIHLVGVLVGSQVAAVAGERLWKLSGRKVNRITALNPNYYVINMGIDIRNANFIEVVYNARDLEQDGHVRFYVDGHNCKEDLGQLGVVKIFAESINSGKFKGVKCESFLDFEGGKCTSHDSILFGENVNKSARGSYFINACDNL